MNEVLFLNSVSASQPGADRWRCSRCTPSVPSSLTAPSTTSLSDEAQQAGICVVRRVQSQRSEKSGREHRRPPRPLPGGRGACQGGKQNRVVLSSILVSAGSQVVLPVFCVERGRWDTTPKSLKTGSHAPPSMRCLFKGGSSILRRKGRQVEVWRFITSKHMATGTSSPTENMSDIFVEHRDGRPGTPARTPVPGGASGIAVAIDGRTVGIDLFDKPETLQKGLGPPGRPGLHP